MTATAATEIEQPIETITLQEDEYHVLDKIIEKLMERIGKAQQVYQETQRMNQMYQQMQLDIAGYSKAVEELIKVYVEKTNHQGQFVYNREKKCLEKKAQGGE